MSIQSLREFIDRSSGPALGLNALVAALDERATGKPLDAALGARIQDLLAVLGAGEALRDVSPQEAAAVAAELRHSLAADALLLHPETRSTSWSPADPLLLQAFGDFARGHALALTRGVVSNLEGLGDRLGKPGAAFLDIGAGAAGLAIQMAELWPNLRIVGIDVWRPSLELARANVAKSKVRDRIELREQAAETLEDEKAFDLAWLPVTFIPERVIVKACQRTLASLRPDGWIVLPYVNLKALPNETSTAAWRLRITMWGGPQWTTSQAEEVLRSQGFSDVRTLPAPPGIPVAMTVGRRKPG
jgi:precorrin-6B methylase 2